MNIHCTKTIIHLFNFIFISLKDLSDRELPFDYYFPHINISLL